MAVEVKLRRWGNSMAVIVPSKLIEQKKLKENDTIMIEVVKEANLLKISNLIKKRKLSAQEAKNQARQGWKT